MTFESLGLLPESLRAIDDQGYTDPTPVQAQAIPVILAGRDLLATAQTGTGKTAAFVLPLLQRLHAHRGPGPRRVRALVIVPTRELALQVEQAVGTYGAHRPVRSTAIYGGVSMDRQVRALRRGVEIVVATPGRLLDHVRQRTIDLRNVEILVLDEADRMLDMGFIDDIRRILGQLPAERQSLLFSATFNSRIRGLAEELLRDPVSIDVAPRNAAATPIRQVVHPVDKGQKRHLLSHLVRNRSVGQVLVFTRTKRGANRLAEDLGKDGIDAAAIHGNKSQSQRVRALTGFKQGRTQVLVATDVAARGLDILALPHVVNFELPIVPEDYVHRIGRTGRAGQPGTAISLVSADEQALVLGIERLLKRSIEQQVVEGFEPSMAFRAEPPPMKGGRSGGARRARGRGAPRSPEFHSRPLPGRSTEAWVGQRSESAAGDEVAAAPGPGVSGPGGARGRGQGHAPHRDQGGAHRGSQGRAQRLNQGGGRRSGGRRSGGRRSGAGAPSRRGQERTRP